MNKLFLDCETTGLNPYKDELQIYGFAFNDHPIEIVNIFNREFSSFFENQLLNKETLKIGHNINFDLLFLNKFGLKTRPPYFDTQLYFHIQNPNESSKLKDLGEKILKRKVKRLEDIVLNKEQEGYIKIGVGNTKGYGYVDLKIISEYLKQDVEITKDLFNIIESKGIDEYYTRIEQPLIGSILDMELKGIKIDAEKLNLLTNKLTQEIKELEKYFANKNINPRSPKQIREFIKNES